MKRIMILCAALLLCAGLSEVSGAVKKEKNCLLYTSDAADE
mgnify:CR=1 FL=1